MSIINDWHEDVLAQVALDADAWMSCDECFDRSDYPVEALLARSQDLPVGFRAHLRGCPACLDEVAALAELAAADAGTGSPGDLLRTQLRG